MTLADLLWLATACYGMHILEEFQLDWRNWARAVIGLRVEWADFYVTNALVVVLGVCAANLTGTPVLALSFPALMLINATFFHVVPFVRTGGRFSPGLFTAVGLFYPVGIACYGRVYADHRLTAVLVAGSLMIGAGLMASPIALLKIRRYPYFRQDR